MGQKFDNESATKELNRFIEMMNIKKHKLDKIGDEKESLISFIEEGDLQVMDDGSLIYKLMYPESVSTSENTIEEVKFPVKRYRTKDVEKAMVGKTDMQNTRLMLSLITENMHPGIFGNMDADDLRNLTEISAFFLPR